MNLLQVVWRSLKGDMSAFRVLFELFYEDAYRSAYLITRNRQQAEDATQEAFLKALQRLDTLQQPKQFGAWIRSIVTRSALDILRREKRCFPTGEPQLANQDTVLFPSTIPIPEQEVERKELRSRVRAVIASLKPAHQQVLVLKFFHELDDQEIAELLAIPLGTVKSRTHRALKLVGEKIAPYIEVTNTQLAPTADTHQQEGETTQ